jgi:hypothetical protein
MPIMMMMTVTLMMGDVMRGNNATLLLSILVGF